jgi:hypothetical protein
VTSSAARHWRKLVGALTIVVLALTLGSTAGPSRADSSSSAPAASISTDQAGYAPGSTVSISGSGFQAGETVSITGSNDSGTGWQASASAVADDSGGLLAQIDLPADAADGTYTLSAAGGLGSGASASFSVSSLAGGPGSGGGGSGPQIITSDKGDYSPGSHVTLAGSNWAAGETVQIHVEDNQGKSWNLDDSAVAGPDGSFTYEFNLPNWFVATYLVSATAPSGTATTMFTDSNVGWWNPGSSPSGYTFPPATQPTTGETVSWSTYANSTTCLSPAVKNTETPFTLTPQGGNTFGSGRVNSGNSIMIDNVAIGSGSTNDFIFYYLTLNDPLTTATHYNLGQCVPVSLNGTKVDFFFHYGPATSATITGTVYNDVNGNGVLDGGETGLAGATVTLTGGNYQGQGTNATSGVNATSGAGGAYSFSALQGGNYTVTFTPPAGYTNSTLSYPVNVSLPNGNSGTTAAAANLFATQPQNTTLTVSTASGTYAGSTAAAITGNLTTNPGGTGVVGKTITIKFNGTTVGTAVTGAGGAYSLASGQSLAGINAATYAGGVTASFAGDTGYNASNASNTLTVNKAPSTTTVTCPASVTYTGSALTPCTASVTGAGGLSLTPTPTYANNTVAGTNTASAAYSFTGDTNHSSSSGSATFTINKASSTTTVTCPASVTYNASAQTPCSATVTGANLSLTPTPTYANNTNAGTNTASASYTFTGDANHNGSSDSKTFSILQAVATITGPTPYSVTYDGAPHTASFTATGVGGADLSSSMNVSGTTHTNAADYPTDPWSFSNANYVSQSGTVHDAIAQASSTTTVTCPASVTYNGSAQTPCSATVTGANLSLTPTPTYANNTNAGTNTASASYTFTGDTNHTGSSNSKNFTISQAAATVTVTGYTVTYDGNAHTASVTATGVGGADLSSSVDVSNTSHTAAGTYNADPWTFTNANYTSQSGTVNDSIAKAASTTTVTCPASVTYNGSAQTPCSATVTGPGLSLTPTPTYANNTNAGVNTASASYTFTGDANHNGSTDSKNFTINQAAATVTVTGYTVTYDGNAHTASVTATGVGGADLSSSVDVSNTSHTAAGTYNADPWTFTNANYVSQSGAVNDKINKANAVISVTGYTVTYNASAHTATGTATGVGGGDLSGLLNLSGTTHTNAGTYNGDSWTFAGNSNYNSTTGTVNDQINQAIAIVSVTPYSVTYDTTAHTATGTATGVGGADLSAGLNLSGTTHTPAGDYPADAWSFSDANYASQSGTVHDAIAKADATIGVTGYHDTFDGSAHTAAGTATGVGGADLSSLLNLSGTTHTNAGTYNGDSWTFAGNTNYNPASGTVNDKIDQAAAAVSVTPYSVTYNGNAHTATGTATGVSGPISGLVLSGTTHTAAGDYPSDAWTFSNANYVSQSGTVHDSIAKADASITVTGYTVTYNGSQHTAAGSATGAQGEDLSSLLDLSGTQNTAAGDYPSDGWTFAGDSNYNAAGGTVHDKINQAHATIVVTPYSVTYDGSSHTATGTATGVSGPISGLDLSGTAHTAADDYTADAWTFSNPNYVSQSGTVEDQIGKANASINIDPYSVTYNANPHTATGSATGVNDEDLSSLLTLSGTTHTSAGDYTDDAWSFAGDSNYNAQSGTAEDTIAQATATISVTPYAVTYDTNDHTATGTATGVGGADLSSSLDLSGTTHTNAGDFTDTWTFSNPNYVSASDTVNDTIAKADATIDVTPYSVIYDGNAHTATGSATGLGSLDLSDLLHLGGTTHTNAGSYTDSWTFPGNGNYNAANGSVGDSIDQAASTTTLTWSGSTYDGNPNPASATVDGIPSESNIGTASLAYYAGPIASGDPLAGAPTDAGTYTVVATFDGNGNYYPSFDVTTITIAKAPLMITASDASLTYGDAAPSITPSYDGFVNGEDSSALSAAPTCSTTYTQGSPVSGSPYSTSCDLATADNYEISYTDGSVSVAKAPATVDFANVLPTSAAYHSTFSETGQTSGDGTISLSAGPDPAVCTLAAGTVTMNTGTGICHLEVSSSEGPNYLAAGPTTFDVTATKLDQNAVWVTFPGIAIYGNSYLVSALTQDATQPVPPPASGTGIIKITAPNQVKDTFTRTDQSLDSNGWAAYPGADPLQIVGNQTTGPGYSYATPSFGADQEEWATITALPASGNWLAVGIRDTLDNTTGYYADVYSDGSADMGSVSGGGYWTSDPGVFQAGDRLGFTAVGDQVSVYRLRGGVLTAVLSQTDTSVTGGGNVWIGTNDSTAGFDNFVGGEAAGACSYDPDSGSILMISGTGTCTLKAVAEGDANYNASTPSTAAVDASKAPNTIVFPDPADATFGDGPITLGATADGGTVYYTAGPSGTCHIEGGTVVIDGAGDCTVVAHDDGNSNYQAADDVSQTFTIGKADATINVTAYDLTYTGTAHTATGTATGVGAANLGGQLDLSGTSHTDAATYAGDAWHFNGGANYNDADGTVTDKISQANATINVTGYTLTYDGSPHTAGGTATGAAAEDLSGLLDLSNTTHTNAGTYNGDAWSFAGNGNYAAANGTANDVINKASTTITFGPLAPVNYGADPQDPGATANAGTVTYTVTGPCHVASGLVVIDGAGICKITANDNGDANHDPATSVEQDLQINKAHATLSLSNLNYTYDGTQKAATVSTTPTGLTGASATYAQLANPATPLNAGDYDVTATLDNPNYEATPVTGTLHIAKADAVINVTPYNVTYNALAHTATGTATGVVSENLSSLLNLSGTTHTAAGTYNGDAWHFAGNANYNTADGTVNDSISKANATVTVTAYNVTYDGSAHLATGTATGAGGANLASLLDLSGTSHTPAGTYNADAWTFNAGNTNPNYNATSGSVNDKINKANATIVVTPYTVTYDTNSHTATGSATGVGALNLSSALDLTGTTHTNAGTTTDTWTFNSANTYPNYNSATGTVSDAINKKALTITASSATVTYGDPVPTITPSYSGFAGTQSASSLTTLPTCSTTYTPTSNVGTYPTSCSGAASGNYSFIYVGGTVTVQSGIGTVAYIGQTSFVTSGSSATTAQVTLSASVTASQGQISTAKVTFTDLLTNKVLASGVPVSAVTGSPGTGTANTIVTLSTGNYGSSEYLIEVKLTPGNYTNLQQIDTGHGGTAAVGSDAYNAAHPTIWLSLPSVKNSLFGGGTIAKLTTSAGSFGTALGVSYSVGINWNNKGVQPQGQILIALPMPDGSLYYVKSNSITSVAFSGTTGKNVTVYTKASVYQSTSTGTISGEGNVSLRMDAVDGSPDQVSFTVLSSQSGNMFYSNDWRYDSVGTLSWRSWLQNMASPTAIQIG